MSGISKRVLETAEKLANALGLHVVGHLVKPFQLQVLEAVLKDHHFAAHKIPGTDASPTPIPDQDLYAALQRNEFFLHYQPQIDIKTGAVIGVEALARWQHPERGLVLPDNFIGRMEELGIIDDLGLLVADRALGELNGFAAANNAVPRLAVNASAHSLHDLKLPDALVSLLKKHGVDAANLILEITESGLMNDLSNTLDVLTRLRVKGVQLSIDDFGTGYAMMQRLVNVPANELKIDRSFVMNMTVNSSDRVMVEKSIEIGHALGMTVVAEGVETEAHLNILRTLGCDVAQGFLISRPLPPEALVRWLAEYKVVTLRQS
jgi:EAL domain-containing protein (putative c-di-GMP-specific phosphodiesterase class I)